MTVSNTVSNNDLLNSEIKYLVSTRIETLHQYIDEGYVIFMVDGTVPGWKARDIDLHYDHHKQGGADIQIDEMPKIDFETQSIIEKHQMELLFQSTLYYDKFLVVTTQLDADACVAAAWLQLTFYHLTNQADNNNEAISLIKDNVAKLRAIAYDCDHLAVPKELENYADFASQAVAAQKVTSDLIIKELNYPSNRKEWTIEQKESFASVSFQRSTNLLLDAVQGKCLFPGQADEAKDYWHQLEADAEQYIYENRISFYQNSVIFDAKGFTRYVDPRAPLKALSRLKFFEGYQNLNAFTLTQREVINNEEFKGYSYTLGVIPLHENLCNVDYTQRKFLSIVSDETRNMIRIELNTFEALTLAELENDSEHFTLSVPEQDRNNYQDYSTLEKLKYLIGNKLGWGGRKTVGGSSWNTPSKLTPEQVIDIVLGNSSSFFKV